MKHVHWIANFIITNKCTVLYIVYSINWFLQVSA